MFKFQRKVIISAFFLLLLCHQHVVEAQNVVDVEVDASAKVNVEDTVRQLQTLGTGTFVPATASHKPGKTDEEFTFAFIATGLANEGKIMMVEAPTGYNVTANCKTTQPTSFTPSTITIGPTTYTLTPVANDFISTCAVDGTSATTASISFSVSMPNTAANELTALKIKFSTTPTEQLSGSNNQWSLKYGNTATTDITGLTVLVVKGWSGLKNPANNIGTPSASGAALRPTSLMGDHLETVGLYFLFTSTIAATHGFIVRLPSDLTMSKTGSCKDPDIDMKTHTCTTAACQDSLKVGDIENDAIKESTDDFGCVAATNNIRMINKAAIPNSDGVYLSFKVKTAKLTEKKSAGQLEIYGCTESTCALPTNYAAYLTDDNLSDYGMTLADVNIEKAGGAVILCMSSFLLYLWL